MTTSLGTNYIICYEKAIAEQNDFRQSLMRSHYIKTPTAGDEFDFKQATLPVYVGGYPYRTVACGDSSSIDVGGKVIKITKVSSGDKTEFAKITFEEIKS